jgi:hypothetical protein
MNDGTNYSVLPFTKQTEPACSLLSSYYSRASLNYHPNLHFSLDSGAVFLSLIRD